jgi:3-deoxy-D-manno-octulosonic-acid transferase
MRRGYNILVTLWFYLRLPFLYVGTALRRDGRKQWRDQLGDYNSQIKHAVSNRHVLWLHAADAPAINFATHLIAALEPRLPNLKIIISTKTPKGMAELEDKVPPHIPLIYAPVDRRDYAVRACKVMHPQALVLLGADLPPNVLWRARETRTPLFLITGRVSPRRAWRYRVFARLYRPLFQLFWGVACPDETEAARLRALGCRPEAIQVLGRWHPEAAKLDERRHLDVPDLLGQIGVAPTTPLLVAGSTQAGEEALLGEVFHRLQPRFPDLFLIVVPEHFERGREVGNALRACGVKFLYRKDITVKTEFKERQFDCLVVNSTGELTYFYQYATVIVAGKRLTTDEGQDPFEPGILGKPIVFGSHRENLAPKAQALLAQSGAVQAHNAQELEAAIADLLANPERAAQLGRNAQRVLRENQGPADRAAAMIIAYLKQTVYVADRS